MLPSVQDKQNQILLQYWSSLGEKTEQKTLSHMKFAYFLTPVSSHIVFSYILQMSALPFERFVGNAVHSQISIPDLSYLCSFCPDTGKANMELLVCTRGFGTLTQEWSRVHVGKRGMRWDLKANCMPFCSTYSPTVSSEDPSESGKKSKSVDFCTVSRDSVQEMKHFDNIHLCR